MGGKGDSHQINLFTRTVVLSSWGKGTTVGDGEAGSRSSSGQEKPSCERAVKKGSEGPLRNSANGSSTRGVHSWANQSGLAVCPYLLAIIWKLLTTRQDMFSPCGESSAQGRLARSCPQHCLHMWLHGLSDRDRRSSKYPVTTVLNAVCSCDWLKE